jgi:NAD(P)-dependent dehydrogenase (short-subunit alcohol dehydrogenase family)
MTNNLTGKVALVTGGSRGIGAAIAKRLAQDGAAVAITYAHAQQKADEVVHAIEAAGGRALAIRADSADAEAVKSAVAETVRTLVRLAPAVAAIPTLTPPPPWVFWDHDQPGIWPIPDDRDDDLNRHPEPAWLDEIRRRVRRRLAQCRQPPVVGHTDWEVPNIRWSDRRLHVVHDW